jgi:hypothetical protein
MSREPTDRQIEAGKAAGRGDRPDRHRRVHRGIRPRHLAGHVGRARKRERGAGAMTIPPRAVIAHLRADQDTLRQPMPAVWSPQASARFAEHFGRFIDLLEQAYATAPSDARFEAFLKRTIDEWESEDNILFFMAALLRRAMDTGEEAAA